MDARSNTCTIFTAQGAPWSAADTALAVELSRQSAVTRAECLAAFPNRRPSAVRRKLRSIRAESAGSIRRDTIGEDWEADAVKGSAKLLAAIFRMAEARAA